MKILFKLVKLITGLIISVLFILGLGEKGSWLGAFLVVALVNNIGEERTLFIAEKSKEYFPFIAILFVAWFVWDILRMVRKFKKKAVQ